MAGKSDAHTLLRVSNYEVAERILNSPFAEPKLHCFSHSGEAFVKNSGLHLALPYVHGGQNQGYVPGFIMRLKSIPQRFLILETCAERFS